MAENRYYVRHILRNDQKNVGMENSGPAELPPSRSTRAVSLRHNQWNAEAQALFIILNASDIQRKNPGSTCYQFFFLAFDFRFDRIVPTGQL